MLQRLLGLLALLGMAWMLGRVLGAGRRPAGRGPARPRRAGPDRAAGEMVRDRVCNTFLPRAKALTAQAEGREHFFCSEACRQKFLAGG